MIQILTDIPAHVSGFRASGFVTRADYDRVVVPVIEQKLKETGEINFLLVVDTDLGNFTMGAWLRDALLGLEHITKWRKAAIVINHDGAIQFTDNFSIAVPGEFKGFRKTEYQAALEWVAS